MIWKILIILLFLVYCFFNGNWLGSVILKFKISKVLGFLMLILLIYINLFFGEILFNFLFSY